MLQDIYALAVVGEKSSRHCHRQTGLSRSIEEGSASRHLLATGLSLVDHTTSYEVALLYGPGTCLTSS